MRKLIFAGIAARRFHRSGTAMAQSPIIIKFSHVVANGHAEGKGRAQVQGACREVHRRQVSKSKSTLTRSVQG